MKLGTFLTKFTENYVGVKVFDIETNVLLCYGCQNDQKFAKTATMYYTYGVVRQTVWDNNIHVYVLKPKRSINEFFNNQNQ